MSKIVNLTPEAFVDLFILCLSWQWRPISLTHTWTTVDKVVKILLGLGVITEDRVTMIRGKERVLRHQHLLRRHTSLLYGAWYEQAEKKVSGELTANAREILSRDRALCIRLTDSNARLNLARLVRDQRIHLTYVGAAHAAGLAEQFAPWVTREAFKAEEARRESLFQGEATRATAASAYRREVEGEGKPQSVRKGPRGTGGGPAVNLIRLW